ncbi:AAA family ATPase [Flavobacterium salilacus subsp. salilacus]|uniref:AAA family ATPase n=1 Tax=Flavobacterium TaxID=237 RepID=UPI001074A1EF|nr:MULTISPECIES: AAA family ATPase [Flavobacterium]KAF2519750.1 AAA family ATPase [Flavobacterium salilacus subsp. salilacus]MBE1614358.1 AAA family ATPase [Flavobacterium sp. SaA2.13]
MNSKLFKAAKSGNIRSYRQSLTEVDDINITDEDGNTSLMIACAYGHTSLAKFIISRGANIDMENHEGMTASNFAIQSENEEIIKLFKPQYKSSEIFESPYKKLVNNIQSIIDDINPIISDMEVNHRAYVIEDFTKILLLATKGEEFGILYKFAFALLSSTIVGDEDSNSLESLKTLPEEEIVEIFIKIYDSQKVFFSMLETYDCDFTLNSFPLFDEDELNVIKKALYEFAEIVVKADGTVTKDEIENLKEINNNYLDHINKEESKLDKKKNFKSQKTENISALDELNDLIGLDNIKEDIKSLINVIKINRLRDKEGLPQFKSSLHAVFMGSPGTGKTTIARILGRIYSEMEVLSGDNFVETDRSGLVAGYVGQTAIKTDKVIKKAMNGVLFIDEAYALSQSNSSNDFGPEAIAAILKRMEDHRGDLAVIVAGYENEMNHFINSNPGLQSRFGKYFYFKDYDGDELTQIYSKMAEKAGFILTGAAHTKVKELFTILYANKGDKFGNARLARNVFGTSFTKHANRTAPIAPITREILTTMEEADIPFDEFAGKYIN